MTAQRAALGFSLHSGWGVASVVTSEPRVVDRRQVDFEPRGYPVQMYHAATGLPLPAATRLISEARAAVEAAMRQMLEDEIQRAAVLDLEVVAVGLAAEPRPTLDDLEKILAVHPRMHRAEGDLYRDALVDAAAASHLPLTLSPPGQLRQLAATSLGADQAGIDRLLAELGRALGPPWQQDHKLATLAALVALN
jgi:hypothetical protein